MLSEASRMQQDVIAQDINWVSISLMDDSGTPSFREVNPADYLDAVPRLPDNPWLNPAARDGHHAGHDGMDPEQLERMIREAEGLRVAGNLDPNTNPLLLFLQTLLPWNRL